MRTEWKMVEGKVEKERERGERVEGGKGGKEGKEGVEVVKEDRVGDFVPAWTGCWDGLWGNHDESGLLPVPL